MEYKERGKLYSINIAFLQQIGDAIFGSIDSLQYK